MKTNKKTIAKTSRKTLEKISALILAVILLCAGTAFATSPSGYAVDVYDGTEITRVETNREDPYQIVKQANIELNEKDRLDLSEFTYGQDSVITVYRAAAVSFTSAEGESIYTVCAGKVSDLLAELKITLTDGQILNVPQDTLLTDGLAVSLMDARNVTVIADGETKTMKFGTGTVKDVLAAANVLLGEADEVDPALDTEISDQLEIVVSRVTFKERTVQEEIPFKKETRKDSKMLVGKSKVIQEGKNGSRNVTYQDKYVNGVLDSSKELSEEILTPATAQITAKGTMKKTLSLSKLKNGGTPISELTPPKNLEIVNGAPTSYSKIIRGKAAAYSARPGAKTASGRKAMPGHIAVNPKQIPYGTEMWIVSTDGYVYGYAIAADTGGFIHQGKFTVDLYMSTTAECRQWGARDVIIYVL